MASRTDELHPRQRSWRAGYALSFVLVGIAVLFASSSPTTKTTRAQDIPAAETEKKAANQRRVRAGEGPAYVVHLTSIEIDEHGNERSTNSKLTIGEGSEASFNWITDAPYFVDDDIARYVEFGHRFRLTATRCKDGSIFVDGACEKTLIRLGAQPGGLRVATSTFRVLERVKEGQLTTLILESPVRRKPWFTRYPSSPELEAREGQPRKAPPSGKEVWRVEFTVNALTAAGEA